MKINRCEPTLKWNLEELWSDHEKMIYKVAHEMKARFTHIPFDELVSEGVFVVLKKLGKWDASRASLTTYVYRCAYLAMLDYGMSVAKKASREIPAPTHSPDEDNPFIQKEAKSNWFKKFFEEVSEETKTLLRAVVEAPEELLQIVSPSRPIKSKEALKRYMMDVLDWTNVDVELAFAEVQSCL
jgi:DNA-directed RNA polymerase specialized sigma24 family protein